MKRIILFAFLFIFTFSNQLQAADNTISYKAAENSLLENSTVIKKAQFSTYKARHQYENTEKNSEQISLSDIKYYSHLIGREFSDYDEVQVILQRDFLPVQAKYLWELSQNNEKITCNALIISLRNLYISLVNAKCNIDVKQQKLKLSEEIYKQSEEKLKAGLISKLDMDQANYNLLKAINDLTVAKRIFDNATRSLNVFIGRSIVDTYDSINIAEEKDTTELQVVEYYIQLALRQRSELIDIQKQIDLDQQRMGILELKNVSYIYLPAREEHSKLKNEIDSLTLKMGRTKQDIENEIKSAYIDIKKESSNLEGIKKAIANQKQNLSHMEAQYKAGVITKSAIDEMKIVISELMNSYYLSVYNYNTKLMKLKFATGIGPAY